MAYVANTLTSANPAADLYLIIEPLLISVGYVLVDTVVIGVRTHKMWRSPAASNAQNKDWYLDVTYTTSGTGNVWFSPFEDFNPATDLGIRGITVNGTGTIEGTYFSRFGATGYALETNWSTVSSTNNALELAATSFGYWISITADRIIGLTTISPTKIIYAGYFLPNAEHTAHAGAALFPLVAGALKDNYSLTGSSLGGTMCTRAPRATTSTGWDQTVHFFSYDTYGTIPEGGFGTLGDATTNQFVGFNTPRGRNVYVVFTAGTNSLGLYPANTGAAAIVGKLSDILVFSATASVSRGDTIQVNGETWVVATKIATYSAAFAFRAV